MHACLGPANAFQATTPYNDLPRLARSHTGYRSNRALHHDDTHPQVTVYPME
ncbi:hypothetical protein [Streptomyces sp. NPDC004230]